MHKLKKDARQVNMLARFVTRVFPLVEQELGEWKNYLYSSPPGELIDQALASIKHKRFHCQGGSIYALYCPEKIKPLVSVIVALQTISDYLDNLCDRVGYEEEEAFRELHLSLIHSLDPPSCYPDYYRFYSHHQDNGYLRSLVKKSNDNLKHFPSHEKVKDKCVQLASLYGEMQVYKHLDLKLREEKLISWFGKYQDRYPEIYWWEFAAAAGSTLGIFLLLAASGKGDLEEEEIEKIMEAYFPWICGLHILLDYLIDQQEDKIHEDLNFVSYYTHREECLERLQFFLQNSLEKARLLPHPDFHTLVVKGLLAMYLSDPKVDNQGLSDIRQDLVNQAGSHVPGMHRLCRGLRKAKIL